jgi:hypothetical protein
MRDEKHEQLVAALNDEQAVKDYKAAYDSFRPGVVPRILGGILVELGNLFYGKKPSYGKFKSIEVIARIPYQSWEVASYMLLTSFYSDEQKAIKLAKTSEFSRSSQDNETMHVVVIAQLAKKHGQDSLFLHTLVPLVFSFFYALASFILYLVSPKSALELNYLFEDHAFAQYDLFIKEHAEVLSKEPMTVEFLNFYGRYPRSEEEFFRSVRNDEIVHRNRSAERALEL